MTAPRTLKVWSTAGLANRLKALVSGRTLAEVAGRAFRFLWTPSAGCGAPFGALFTNRWAVDDLAELDPALEAQHVTGWALQIAAQLLDDPRPDIVLGTGDWLVPTGRTWPALRDRCADLLNELTLQPPLVSRVLAFQARHFRPTMIGVHLRRGDFHHRRPDIIGNAEAAAAAVDRFLHRHPDAGIVLCTDDGASDGATSRREGLRERFIARYGDRVAHPMPRSLDRRSVEGIEDALVELHLLRLTHMVVGTTGSSFSGLAAFGRNVPCVLVGGGGPRSRRPRPRVWQVRGHWLVHRARRFLRGGGQHAGRLDATKM